VRSGESQTVPALGGKIWDYYAQKPEESAAFTKAMHGFTSGIVQEVARVVDTSTAKLAVDIGGASGTLVHSLYLGAGTVDATENWWGCAKGPSTGGCSSVEGNGVSITPFLTSPVSRD
jgi:hypothetical protein